MGACGVKVWVYKGEIMEHDPMAQDKRLSEANDPSRPAPQRDRPERSDGDRRGRRDRNRSGDGEGERT
jgi:small subunit ribosomal protein S3